MTLFTPELSKVLSNTGGTKKSSEPLFTPELDKMFKTPEPAAPTVPAAPADDASGFDQLSQGLEDFSRLGVSGLTYGLPEGLARLAGNKDYLRMTEEARVRHPVAGPLVEIGAGLLSPVTKVVGAGATAARAAMPAARTLAGWLGRAAVTSGEGATLGGTGALLSGRPEDVLRDATVGAVLPHAVTAAGKAVSIPSRIAASTMSNRAQRQYTRAFDVGRSGSLEAEAAFSLGMSGKAMPQTKDREVLDAWRAGSAMRRWQPSAGSIGSAISNLGAAHYIHPAMALGSLALLGLGSPRVGAGLAHGIGRVLGGLDMVGSRAAVPVVTYEQQKRQRYGRR